MKKTRVIIAGSTGSIGVQGLDVVRDSPERFEVVGLAAHSSVDDLCNQVGEFGVKHVAVTDVSAGEVLRTKLDSSVNVYIGARAAEQLVENVESEVVLNAVVGFAGLGVTLATLEAGRRLALANKESLVGAGDLVNAALMRSSGTLIPVDSEHGALHQCLRSETESGAGDFRRVSKLLLTASGGPFRGKSIEQLQSVTIDDALAHPNWSMGPKITVDSSTLFNKGLEVIEAHVLFDIDYDDIEVVVHPQSILHSAVEFSDASVIGQMSKPDMRLPIGYALGYPERLDVPYGAINWATLGQLTFEAPDAKTFRCLDLAFVAGRSGGLAPLWLNAANEVAVQAFLDGGLSWTAIPDVIEQTLEKCPIAKQESLELIVESDSEARTIASSLVLNAH